MDCLCLNARRAARNVTRLYEEHLSPCGLTPAQFGLLAMLAERPGLSQAALAEVAGLDASTLSRNLKLLSESQWIESARSSADRRQTVYRVTVAGGAIQQQALPLWMQAQQVMQQALGPEWQASLETLKRLGLQIERNLPDQHGIE